MALATYNGERFLSRQLSSIATQSRLPDELIVSDDHSTDGTVKIVEAFAGTAAFPVDIAVNPHRVGVTKNFERAVGRCSGDIVVMCDQDDVWLPHRVEVVEEALVSDPDAALAFSDAYLINEDGRRRGQLWDVFGLGPRQQARLRRDPFGQLMGRSVVSGCTMAFRAVERDLLLPFPVEQTGTRTSVLHDRWISLVLASAFAVAVIDEPLVEYRLHPAQRVGIPKLQIRKLVPSSVLRWRSAAVPTPEHSSRLEATIGLLGVIDARLNESLGDGRRADGRARVDEAVAHLGARLAVGRRPSRAGRLQGVIRELGTGRYQHYSLGLASAFADIARPGRPD